MTVIATPQTAPAGTRVARRLPDRSLEFATVTGWVGRDTIGIRYDNGATYCGPTWRSYMVATACALCSEPTPLGDLSEYMTCRSCDPDAPGRARTA